METSKTNITKYSTEDCNQSNIRKERATCSEYVDNKSIDGVLFCAGGVPIDRISSNRSVPAFGAWVAPESLHKKGRPNMNYSLAR